MRTMCMSSGLALAGPSPARPLKRRLQIMAAGHFVRVGAAGGAWRGHFVRVGAVGGTWRGALATLRRC